MKALPFPPSRGGSSQTFSRRFPPAGAARETILYKTNTTRIDAGLPGSRFAVAEGLLWITQEGDRADYLVGPGETFVTTRPGRIVAQALTSDSRFEFQPGRA